MDMDSKILLIPNGWAIAMTRQLNLTYKYNQTFQTVLDLMMIY